MQGSVEGRTAPRTEAYFDVRRAGVVDQKPEVIVFELADQGVGTFGRGGVLGGSQCELLCLLSSDENRKSRWFLARFQVLQADNIRVLRFSANLDQLPSIRTLAHGCNYVQSIRCEQHN
jgi:hypothetical protein